MASEELRRFFSSLITEADLQKLITEQTHEGLYLEFKTKKNRSKSDLDESDSWQFSRALSGFANSDGGVLLWGIETDKQERAARLKPIRSVGEFYSRLKKSLLSITQPVVDGIQMESILKAGSSTDGYVKCLIPSSDKAPHRAMLADREYFTRTTEGFYKLEHFDLEDMFGRRPHPSLSVLIELVPRPGGDPHEELHFHLSNEGRGVARYSGLLCRIHGDVAVVGGGGNVTNITGLNKGLPTLSYTDNVGVIHPNRIPYAIGHGILRRPNKGEPLRVTVSLFCENMMMRSQDLTVISEASHL